MLKLGRASAGVIRMPHASVSCRQQQSASALHNPNVYLRFGHPSPHQRHYLSTLAGRSRSYYERRQRLGGLMGCVTGLTLVLLSTKPAYCKQQDYSEMADGLYVFGYNEHGTIPESFLTSVSIPTRVKFFDDKGVRHISFAERYGACIDDSGNLYIWGELVPSSRRELPPLSAEDLMNLNGEYLESARKDDSDRTATGGLTVSEKQIVEDKVTETVKETVIKRKSTPRLRRRESVQFANRIRVVHTPVRVNATSKLSQVACGANTIYALSEDGTLFVLPLNSLTEEPTSACLTLMNVDKVDTRQDPIIHVDCGEHHVVALTLHGKVLSAPQSSDGNKYGQLGLGHFKDLYQTQVEDVEKGEPYTKLHLLQGISNQIITRVACGKAHTLALTASGEVFGFGSDRCFQLGLGGWDSKLPTARHSPTYMTGLWPSGAYDGSRKVVAIAAGGECSVVVVESADGGKTEVLTCGNGVYGTLGNGAWNSAAGALAKVKTISDNQYYDEVEMKTKSVSIHKVSCGDGHAVAVLDTRYSPSGGLDVYSWGYNKFYQLGNRKRNNTAEPISMTSIFSTKRRLQLSHKNDNHRERSIVCKRFNTAVYLPTAGGLESDMGRRGGDRNGFLAGVYQKQQLERRLLANENSKTQADQEYKDKLVQIEEERQMLLQQLRGMEDLNEQR